MERGRGGGLARWGWQALERMHRRDAVRPDGGAEETDIEGKADGLTGLGRDGPLLNRR